MAHWVPLPKYLERTGETAEAVNTRLRRGFWLKGIHAKKPEGAKDLWINEQAVDDWAAGVKPTLQHGNGK